MGDTIYKLIEEQSVIKEGYIFEELQAYMDFKDNNATWKQGVRLRLKENKEANKDGRNEAIDDVLKLINGRFKENKDRNVLRELLVIKEEVEKLKDG